MGGQGLRGAEEPCCAKGTLLFPVTCSSSHGGPRVLWGQLWGRRDPQICGSGVHCAQSPQVICSALVGASSGLGAKNRTLRRATLAMG